MNLNNIMNIAIIIVVIASTAVGTFVLSRQNETNIINNYLQRMALMKLPTYIEVIDYKFFNLVGHRFHHEDDCVCKIF